MYNISLLCVCIHDDHEEESSLLMRSFPLSKAPLENKRTIRVMRRERERDTSEEEQE